MPPNGQPESTAPGSQTEYSDISDDVAAAEAVAHAARARAIRLRLLADDAGRAEPLSGGTDADPASGPSPKTTESAPTVCAPRRRRTRLSKHFTLRRPGGRRLDRRKLWFVAGFTVIGLVIAVSGELELNHRVAEHRRTSSREFADAARDSMATMLTVGAATARADIQRFVDSTTGGLKAGLLLGGDELVAAAEKSAASTKGVVQAVAVQSMTDNAATVLVAATSEVSATGRARPELRPVRLVVDLQRNGDQIKVSKVEIVP